MKITAGGVSPASTNGTAVALHDGVKLAAHLSKTSISDTLEHSKSIRCRFYESGTCKKGDNCRFRHDLDDHTEESEVADSPPEVDVSQDPISIL